VVSEAADSDLGFTLFSTAIGTCAIAWDPDGVVLVDLPQGSAASSRDRMVSRLPQANESPPPAEMTQAISSIVALLDGVAVDLADIRLNLRGIPAFRRRVYEAAREVPPGTTVTYGELASRVGHPGSARAVGRALGCNPFPIVVPCHRVIAANGRSGGFSAHGGVTTKLRMLAIEGVGLAETPPLFDLPAAVRA
jgi:methylated-DNA-[protein]-cysteine S-methyltransferase